jgi:hypothetical protein
MQSTSFSPAIFAFLISGLLNLYAI